MLCQMIPAFQGDGNLPSGLHHASWKDFYRRFGTNEHRCRLLNGLKAALENLRAAGCQTAYVDGGFVTSNELPKDFDGCWDVIGVDPGKLDPVLLTFDPGRAVQKAKYHGELFPSNAKANPRGDTFLDFFQSDRDGNPKGIIVLDLRRLP
jgi:hypothetical protein